MAQDLSPRRLEIARTAVSSATAFYDAETGLKVAAALRAESGNFTDDELQVQPDLVHLTAFLIGMVLDSLVSDIELFLDGHVGNNNGNPTRRSLLLQMRH